MLACIGELSQLLTKAPYMMFYNLIMSLYAKYGFYLNII